jgi:hypothetical protein
MSLQLHPQNAIHLQSLISKNPTQANAFWLKLARDVDWIKPPKVAYGKQEGTDAEVRSSRSP